MKTGTILIMILVSFTFQLGFGNPLPLPLLLEYSVDPPWIEVLYLDDLTGDTIRTTEGSAVITSFIPNQDYVVLLDSSNTTGFTLNPEGDSIIFLTDYEWGSTIGYGTYGSTAGSPPPGLSITVGIYEEYNGHDWDFYFVYDFCSEPTPGQIDYNFLDDGPRWGDSDLIINEVCINNTWRPNSSLIELYNMGEQPVNADEMLLIGNSVYHFPENTIISPGEFFVIDENDFPDGFALHPLADVLYLVDRDNYDQPEQYSIVDQVGWSSNHGENVSFMRYPDGDVNPAVQEDFKGYNDETSYTFENGFPSRGAPNRHQYPGFVVIGARADSVNTSTTNIYWTDPIWVPDFELSVLVKSIDNYPQTPYDGMIIYQGTDQQFSDDHVPPNEMIYYTIFAKNYDGEYSSPTGESRTCIILNSSGIDDKEPSERYISLNCHPNPFNAQTTISFSLENESYVKISIYDIAGRLVDVLAQSHFQAGINSVIWNASDLPSGIYFYSVKTEQNTLTQKAVLLK